jgi:hypothetical protein
MISETITWCGGENIFANSKGEVAEISQEAVFMSNPNIVIQVDATNKINFVSAKPKYVTISADLIERPGPRFILGAEEICKEINR